MTDPATFFSNFLKQCGGAVLDGGLATELERLGADLNDQLWSAKCLISSPHLIRKASNKPLLVYPNSGETYDPDRKEWIASTGVVDEDFVSYVDTWRQVGASMFGGSCRTTPNAIKGISRVLHNQVSDQRIPRLQS